MVKRPVSIACIGYIIGIIYGLYFKNISIALIFLGVILLLITINRKIKRYIKVLFPKKAIIILILFVTLGACYIVILNNKYNKIYQIQGEIQITGIVEKIEEKDYSNKYIVKIKTINSKRKSNIKFILYTNNNQELLQFGDYIKVKGEYSKPDSLRNYKGFSYEDYLKQNNIYGTINATEKPQVLDTQKINFISSLANRIKKSIVEVTSKNLSKNVNSVFLGILLGEKSQISDEINSYFKQGSMAHILAVSGAHVSYIMLALSIIFGKINKKIYLIISIIILTFFMVLTDFAPSVVRACTMATIALIAKLIHTKSDIYINLNLSALVILLNNPYTLFNIGFQLTYLGTVGIILVGSKILKKDKNYNGVKPINSLKSKIKKFISNSIAISFSVQVLIFPIILLNFNTVSYNFLISGTIATPIFALIMLIGIFFIIFVPFRDFCFPLIEILVNFLIFISKSLSKLPFSTFFLATPNIIYVITYYAVLFSTLILKSKLGYRIIKSRKKVNILLKKIIVLALIICVTTKIINIAKDKNLKIFFIDVGQGDSCVIVTPKNNVIVIDGGGSSDPNFDVGKNTVVPYLLDRGITKVDYLMVSHFDNDHCGGLMYVIKTLNIKNLLISKQSKKTKEYENLINLVNTKNINIIVVKKGDTVNIEKEINFKILYPTSNLKFDDLNNNSIVAKLMYKNFSILFTGDIEKQAEQAILKLYNSKTLKSTVLKVAHHGSKTSSTEEFLKTVNPKIALIGVGKDNNFGHPNGDVLKRLENINTKIYRTDINGEISIETTGTEVEIKCIF